MTSPLAADDAFFQSLREFDRTIFLEVKAKGCQDCGGSLDTSNIPRKPRGVGEKEETRFSLCCREDGCRKRVTPPSLRFFGRKVYPAWVVILALDFCEKLGLSKGIARQTLARWRTFWKDRLLEENPFMRWARAHLPPGIPGCQTPAGLLSVFKFPAQASWIPILKFFNPSF
jgi:hypothetical protein